MRLRRRLRVARWRAFRRSTWERVLHDRREPGKTSLAFGLGALIGTTPILGVHTWLAVSLSSLLRLPQLTCVAGSNLSNPLTFVPLTLLEIRVGQALLGRSGGVLPDSLDADALKQFVVEAWTGYAVVGPAIAVVAGLVVALAIRLRAGGPDQK